MSGVHISSKGTRVPELGSKSQGRFFQVRLPRSSLWPHLRLRPGVLGLAGLSGHRLRASALSPERGQRDGPLCGKGASPGQT